MDSSINENDPLPFKYKHISHGETKVKDTFYITVSDLISHGLSFPETCNSICTVVKSMFGRKWKILVAIIHIFRCTSRQKKH